MVAGASQIQPRWPGAGPRPVRRFLSSLGSITGCCRTGSAAESPLLARPSPASAWTVVCDRSPTARSPTASSSSARPTPPESSRHAYAPRSAHGPLRIPAPVARMPRDNPHHGSTACVVRRACSLYDTSPARRSANSISRRGIRRVFFTNVRTTTIRRSFATT